MAHAASSHERLRQFRELILAETGIRLPPSKDSMIAARLRKRLIALDLPTLDAYFEHIFDGGALSDELTPIIELVTTNKTDFFREPAHYAFLANRIIPEAVARTRPGQTTRFRFWSAASSTGAEAWSAAMVLARAAPKHKAFDWRILGTDISPRVLDKARHAIFPEADFAPVPADLREAYVMSARMNGQSVGRIVPELRAQVKFEALNLIEPPFPLEGGIDVAFLRNVLIYFEAPTQAQVIRSVSEHVRPGGYLVVGHAESMIVRLPGFKACAPGVYRKEEMH
ncbi:protein-glutamate O-methyltransferase CheR [Pararhodobacter sp. CCB-MM2]|uniref:CheR family methyltransferase n=1 Tax=Pararhodobacter sp. CCB-MM2 TaxID=1786003 RepID=UPI00082DFC48|nr:protein-glutamate O-methyltransferase CheR [Pararhodobacter sp. CCB-MM2]